jgi:hypothetical protein
MNTERAQVGWRFWLWWVLASTVGLAVGMLVRPFAFYVVGAWLTWGGGIEVVFALDDVVALEVAFALSGALGGASVGIAQWLVLRRQVSRAGWWVLASSVGLAVGSVVGPDIMPDLSRAEPTFVVGIAQVALRGVQDGASIGIAQWLVLRRRVARGGWWVLASTVGLAVGVLFSVAAGVIYAPITGGVLVWLLRHPVTEEPSPPQAAA